MINEFFINVFFTRRNVQQILKLPQICKTRLFSIMTQPVKVVVVVNIHIVVTVYIVGAFVVAIIIGPGNLTINHGQNQVSNNWDIVLVFVVVVFVGDDDVVAVLFSFFLAFLFSCFLVSLLYCFLGFFVSCLLACFIYKLAFLLTCLPSNLVTSLLALLSFLFFSSPFLVFLFFLLVFLLFLLSFSLAFLIS